MRKILYYFFSLAFLVISTNATYTESSSNGYNSPISDSTLSFKASISWNTIKTYWSAFTKDEDNFVYYKIIKSQKNSSPVYPDDGYIYYTTDININSYTDKSPLEWTSYYRVCAITNDKNRYCSDVIKIIYKNENSNEDDNSQICVQKTQPAIEKSTWKCKNFSTPCDVPKGWKQVEKCEVNSEDSISSSLSSSVKTKLDILLNNFISKLENKYSENSKRISVLESLVVELEKIAKKNSKMSSMVNYLIEGIKIKKEKYTDDLWDLEDIFQNIID